MRGLQETLQELAAHHGIPGAVVGVAEDGQLEAEADNPADLSGHS